MSFLPYDSGRPGGWILSGATSLGVHAGLIVLLTVGVAEFFEEREVPVARPEFQITLEQFETDVFVDTELSEGSDDGLDGPDEAEEVEDGDTLDSVEEGTAIDAEDVDAEVAETADVEDALETEAQEAEEADLAEAADLLEPDPLDSQDADEAVAPEVEEADETEAAEADAPQAEEAETAEATDLEALDAREAEVAQSDAAEAVDATEDAAAADALAADVAEDTTALDALPAQEVAETDAEDVAPAPSVDAVAADQPDEAVALAPTETDVFAGDGAARLIGGSEIEAAPEEGQVASVAGDDVAAQVVPGDAVAAIGGPETPDALPPEEDFAVLAPQTSELPPLAGQEDVTLAPRPLDTVAPVEPLDTAEAVGSVEPLDPVDPVTNDSTTLEGSDVTPRRRQPRVPPTESDLAIGDLIQRIRANTSGDCVIALPRRDGEDSTGLALMAAEDRTMTTFSDQVLTRESDADIRQTRTLVDERQCPALSYLAQNRDYPATRIGMRLDSVEVPSGNQVSGIMRGVAGRNLGLFLIDNNGVVQDLDRFVSISGDFYRFQIPVTRVGPRRDTQHLLLAVASTQSLATLKDRSGQSAEDFFGALSNDLARQASLALVAFDVR